MTLKEKIQQMLNLGFTCGQIGKICECHGTTISSWLRGASNLSKRMEESIEQHISSFIQKIEEIWS
jgi:DNA-binding transcriptional MerR regulator